jgi:hypothetical protein
MAKKKAKKAVMTQEHCLERMFDRFGTQAGYVDAEVYMTALEVEKAFGSMCKDYEPLCPCCRAWFQWNQAGKVTVTLERDEVLKLIGARVK